jgi:phenylpyruvate tautomerase PptA (4-oxalocrotonate tautomerase family)
MPNIFVHIPKNSFPGEARSTLVRRINEAAAQAEQIPNDPRKRALCWVLIDEIDSGAWTCGGNDLSAQLLTCVAMVYLPVGVLDDSTRALYVKAFHEAFKQSVPLQDQRQLVTSVVLHEVIEGRWGANGEVWRLANFAKAAGFAHLQHLVS